MGVYHVTLDRIIAPTKNQLKIPKQKKLPEKEPFPDINNCKLYTVHCKLFMIFPAGIDFISSVNLLEEHDSEKSVGECHF